MNFVKVLVALSLGVLATVARADRRDAILEIESKLETIREDLRFTEASEANLRKAIDKLREARDLVNTKSDDGDGDSDDDKAKRKACNEFAFTKYNVTYNSAESAERAAAFCKIPYESLEVIKFAQIKYNGTTNSGDAMDLAGSSARVQKEDLLPIIEFAFAKYNGTYNSKDSIAQALKQTVSGVVEGDLQCLKDAFERFNRSNNSASSMDLAFGACS